MNDEKINKAIRGFLGWDDVCHCGESEATHTQASNHSFTPYGVAFDYCKDLNAMHEAEKTFDIGQMLEYYRHLIDLETGEQMVFHMTARQRAEAFCKAVGIWEDGQ